VNQQVERRRCDRDPIDVLTPEVFALLKLCGGVREGDIERDRPDRAPGRGVVQITENQSKPMSDAS
jgi:hypothetical protein